MVKTPLGLSGLADGEVRAKENFMAEASRTFRIFISSTFSDLKEERNALQEHVFPRLRELCMQHGCRFQAIDLRWGVSEEAALDQQTVKICLEEIARCQKVTPKPNFIVLLGDRYGWRPLPPEIEAEEFEEILGVLSENQRRLLCFEEIPEALLYQDRRERTGWYRRDDNAVPAVYCLRPRVVNYPEDPTEEQQREAERAEYDDWCMIERSLRKILVLAMDRLGWSRNDPKRLKFEASATHQEILRGVMEGPDTDAHVFAFFRGISNLDDLAAALPDSEIARGYVDTDEEHRFDAASHDELLALKNKLEVLLKENTYEYKAQWVDGSDISTDHIGRLPDDFDECISLVHGKYGGASLCVDVWKQLAKTILDQIDQIKQIAPLNQEIIAHREFGKNRVQHFVGRTDILADIDDYLQGPSIHPLVIYGPSGSGKSALMAKAVKSSQHKHGNAELVCRFIGATPVSTDIRSLLQSLCEEITHDYGDDTSTIPLDYKELVQDFPKRLAMATREKPLLIFLDALDQLNSTDNAHNLNWLPLELPENVWMVVSILEGEEEAGACLRAAQTRFAQLPSHHIRRLQDLTPQEGEAALNKLLDSTGRTLTAVQREAILNSFTHCPKPLYLKLAFEEARRWKSHTEKTELGQNIPGIIHDLFARLSEASNHGDLLVFRSLGYLAAARNGLTEDELLDVLSRDEKITGDFHRRSPRSPAMQQLPVVVWSRLYFDLEPYLTERVADGTALLTFYHRQLGEVVTQEFLGGEAKAERHKALADYFRAKGDPTRDSTWSGHEMRGLTELPHHLAGSRQYGELAALLSDIHYLDGRCRTGNIFALIQDYELLPTEHQAVREYGDFLLKHAQRLAKYRGLLFTLIHHEGFNAAREKAVELSRHGRWQRPWIETAPAWMPDVAESPAERETIEVVARCDFGHSCASDLAGGRQIAFFVKRVGELGIMDLAKGSEWPQIITTRRLRPLAVFCSSQADYLVVAFENGEADLFRLVGNDSGILSQALVATLRYLVPEFESPRMEFVGNAFWYQAASGVLVWLDLDADRPEEDYLELPGGFDGAELSGIAPTNGQVVFGFRCGRDARLLVFEVGGRGATSHELPEIDIVGLCPCGTGQVAAALTNYRLTVFDVSHQIRALHEMVLTQLPTAMCFTDGRLVWIAEGGTVHTWVLDGAAESRELKAPEVKLGYAQRLVAFKSRFSVVTRSSAMRFALMSGTRPERSGFTMAFRNAVDKEGYYALQDRDTGTWLIDGVKMRETLISVHRLRPHECATDGMNHFFGVQSIGQAIVLNLNTHRTIPIPGIPPRITSVAGNPEGGFWLAGADGTIHYVGLDMTCVLVNHVLLENASNARFECWQGLSVWLGVCLHDRGSGTEWPNVFEFYQVNQGIRGALRRIGRRFFYAEEGRCLAFTYRPAEDKLWTLWANGYVCSIKFGTPRDFIEKREQVAELKAVDRDVNDIRIAEDGSVLYLLSENGNLFRLNSHTFETEGVFSGSVPLTSLAMGSDSGEPLLCIEGGRRMLFCSFNGGLR